MTMTESTEIPTTAPVSPAPVATVEQRKFLPWLAGVLILPAAVLTGAWLFTDNDRPAGNTPAVPAATQPSATPEPLDARVASAACNVAMHDEFNRRADMTITSGKAMVSHVTLSAPTTLNDAWTYAGVVEYIFVTPDPRGGEGITTTDSIGMTCTVTGTKASNTALASVTN